MPLSVIKSGNKSCSEKRIRCRYWTAVRSGATSATPISFQSPSASVPSISFRRSQSTLRGMAAVVDEVSCISMDMRVAGKSILWSYPKYDIRIALLGSYTHHLILAVLESSLSFLVVNIQSNCSVNIDISAACGNTTARIETSHQPGPLDELLAFPWHEDPRTRQNCCKSSGCFRRPGRVAAARICPSPKKWTNTAFVSDLADNVEVARI
jgi:hypothetical protein